MPQQAPSWPIWPVPPPDPTKVWSNDNFNAMAKLWNLSEEEKVKMRLLQERLSDIVSWKNDPYQLVRYFRECRGQLDTVEEKVRAMIAWRQEHNMESFLMQYGSPSQLMHHFPVCVLEGTDLEGDPIYLARFGATDIYPLFKHFGEDAMVEYVLFIREMTNHPDFWKPYELSVGHRVRAYTVIFDLGGLSTRQLRSCIRSTMKRTSTVVQNYYMGWCKRLLYIRAPTFATKLWSLRKHFYTPEMQDKMQLCGHSDYLNVLDKYVDREVLPSVICPTQGKGRPMKGYFENINLQGGTIPSSLFQQQSSMACSRPTSNDGTCPASIDSSPEVSTGENEWRKEEPSIQNNVKSEFLFKGCLVIDEEGDNGSTNYTVEMR